MNLTVFGATGGVGRHVVTQALDRGDHVTAYVRTPAKLGLDHSNLSVVAGELTDEAVRPKASSATSAWPRPA